MPRTPQEEQELHALRLRDEALTRQIIHTPSAGMITFLRQEHRRVMDRIEELEGKSDDLNRQ